MNPGKLGNKIIIQKIQTETVNAVNELEPVYDDWLTLWANVQPLQGKEYIEAKKLYPETYYKIDIRYSETNKGIDTTNRVLFKGKVLNIESVLNIDEANKAIQLRCYEKGTGRPYE